MEYCLQTRHLGKRYRHFRALDDLNMNIEKGAIYGLIGRNGAGKTTLIRLICGLQNPTEGSFLLYGADSRNQRAMCEVRRRMGAVVETPSIYLGMSARENVRRQYELLGRPDDSGAAELLRYVGLSGTGNKKAKDFSLGMRQRLGIAIALAGNPDFIVLDEPVNGLDPQGIVEIRELILKLNREMHITVLISSHILGELSKLATHYGFIDKGRLIKEISAADLEAACRKCLRVTVSDVTVLSRILQQKHLDYRIRSDSEADIYSPVSISSLAMALAGEGVDLIRALEQDEDLETYYINLIGGGAAC